MKKNGLFSFLFLMASVISGQSPVSWTFTAKKLGVKTYEVHMTATIQNGWHIYSQNQPEDLADLEAQRQMEFEDNMEDDEYSQPPPTTKPPRPQDKFEIDLTKGQQKQYGTQFKTPEGIFFVK